MLWYDYLLIVACASFVVLVIFFHFFLKRKGKSLTGECSGNCAACNGNCSKCGHSCDCNKLLEEYHKSKTL